MFIRQPSPHSPLCIRSDKLKIAFAPTLSIIKQRVVGETTSIKKIFTTEIGKAIRENNLEVDEKNCKHAPVLKSFMQSLQRQRRKIYPMLPNSTSEINLEGRFKVSNDNKTILRFDSGDKDRILCFMSDFQMEMLSKSEIWQSDGTFSVCEKHYYQVYKIHGFYKVRKFRNL